jgi:hypothetical protein
VGIKPLGRKAVLLRQSDSKCMNGGNTLALPETSSSRSAQLVKHRENFACFQLCYLMMLSQCRDYIASMIGWLMILGQLVQWELAGELQVPIENLPKCHFVPCRFYLTMTRDRNRAYAVICHVLQFLILQISSLKPPNAFWLNLLIEAHTKFCKTFFLISIWKT